MSEENSNIEELPEHLLTLFLLYNDAAYTLCSTIRSKNKALTDSVIKDQVSNLKQLTETISAVFALEKRRLAEEKPGATFSFPPLRPVEDPVLSKKRNERAQPGSFDGMGWTP